MISVEILKGAAALDAIPEEWERLVGDSFTAAFSNPGWHLAWVDAFPQQRIAVVTARDEGRLVGILPLARFRTDARGLYFTEVAPLARGDYLPPVVAPEYVATALPAMLDAAFAHFGRRGVFWWPNIPVTDPSVPVLREYFQAHKMPFVEDREVAPRLRLDGCDFAAAEKMWSSSHRIDVRRQRKRLAEKGPVSLWQPATYAEADAALTEFFKVHDDKWLAQGFPGRFQDPKQQQHFRAILSHSSPEAGSNGIGLLIGASFITSLPARSTSPCSSRKLAACTGKESIFCSAKNRTRTSGATRRWRSSAFMPDSASGRPRIFGSPEGSPM
jgi:CelD/BcsL family acetyltransferase involved in cellulose biosynthesis